ncbi:MAG TPA: enoyl-CoA hydratase/isomerase family protein [Burkholderiaceae bacterium]|nr:enoyl-CoA hydratase/isomerase family protein [Burkholderiaceae bacterium]
MPDPASRPAAPAGPDASAPAEADRTPVLSIDGARATIRLCRPSQHNRIDPDDLPVVHAHLDAALAAPGVRALVFEGTGTRTFSSGYTLQAIASRLEERAFEGLLDRVETLRLPTVAAIRGGVYGGATDLALCCDLRIGTTASRMFMPAVRFGLHYYPAGMRRYVERLGAAAASRLFLTAATIDADEMLRIGFLSQRVEPEALDGAVDAAVAAFSDAEPGALAAMKASLAELASGRADPAVLERRFLDSLASPALRERLARRLGD